MSLGEIGAIAGWASLGLAAAWYASTSLFMVGQKQEALITSFGKHVRTEKDPGLHMKLPVPFNLVAEKVYTGTQQVTEDLQTKTKDDLFVGLPITIQYEIKDPAVYYFDKEEPLEQIKKIVSAAVRTNASAKQFQDIYDDREEISQQVIETVGDKVKEYGVDLLRIVVDEPKPPKEIEEAYNKVEASKRLRDAANNESEADKVRIVKRAEAEKEAQILHGQGVAGFRKEIFHNYEEQIDHLKKLGIENDEATGIMMQTMNMDVLRDIGHAGNMVIVTEGTHGGDTGRRIAEMQSLKAVPGGPVSEQNNRPRHPHAFPAAEAAPVPGPA